MKTAAIQVRNLVRSMGIAKARIAGHDIGLMVAYAYAALFPKLVVMDAFLPGVQGWEPIYNSPNYWHFSVQRAHGGSFGQGPREDRLLLFLGWPCRRQESVDPQGGSESIYRSLFASRWMHASWEYFVPWPRAAKDFAEMSQTKLTMPVLSIGGDKSLGEALGAQMKLVAENVTVVIVKNSGHWILEEQPKQTGDALMSFL